MTKHDKTTDPNAFGSAPPFLSHPYPFLLELLVDSPASAEPGECRSYRGPRLAEWCGYLQPGGVEAHDVVPRSCKEAPRNT